MRINGIDIRRFGAKQLTVETQPPKMAAGYELFPKSLLPVEYETDVPMGTMNITIYFRERNRAALERTMSSFMEQFGASCIIDEIKGYKGKFKAFLTDDKYTKTLKLEKKILELSFDGYFFDEEKEAVFDAKTSGRLYAEGSRKPPCIIEVTAKSSLTGYVLTVNGDAYTVETLAAGKTIIIDGLTGKITMDGENAFPVVDLWQFPRLRTGENALTFSSNKAKVKIRYVPMWL